MNVKNIILDFGHGGIDSNGDYTTAPNKMHAFNNGQVAYEGMLNRQIGGLLYTMLRNYYPDINVECTVVEDDPRDLSLGWRVRVANKYPPDETIFISIHSNAFNTRVRGFELYTSRGVTKSDDLAEEIAKEIEVLYDELNLKLRYDFSDGDRDKEVDFYVLRKTRCPAVLLECLFFDNWEDYQLLSDVRFQMDLAYRIFKGISRFLKKI